MKEGILKEIVKKIKSEKIQPEPKWKLRFKNYVFWLFFVGMIFFGALFFSLIIFNILDLDFKLVSHLEFHRKFNLIMTVIPYLWVWFLLLFLFLSFLIFRKTRKGYRYETIFVASLIIAGIFFLGILVHFLRIDKRMDETFFRKTPPHFRAYLPFRENRLRNSDAGFLTGEIVNSEEKNFLVKDFQEKKWKVLISSQTQLKGNVKIINQEKIFIIGNKIGENLFEAFLIRPLEPPHFFEKRKNFF